jgi:hypothetical protein
MLRKGHEMPTVRLFTSSDAANCSTMASCSDCCTATVTEIVPRGAPASVSGSTRFESTLPRMVPSVVSAVPM